MNIMLFLMIFILSQISHTLDATVKTNIDPCAVSFGPTVFQPPMTKDGNPVLFFGANNILNTVTGVPYVLARLVLQRANGVPPQAQIQSLTPAMVTLNGVQAQNPIQAEISTTPNAAPPTVFTVIPNLSLLNYQYPAFTAQDFLTAAGANGTVKNANQQVYLLTDPLSGSTMLQTTNLIDAGGGTPVGNIPALVGSDRNYIFAAVSQMGANFGDALGTNRGIAVVQRLPVNGVDTLQVDDAANFSTASGPAVLVDVQAQTGLIAFTDIHITPTDSITQALLDNGVDMAWTGTLQRLYVGLDGVHRDDPAKSGGALGGFMGRINSEQAPCGTNVLSLVLDPLVYNPHKDLFYDEDHENTSRIPFGFYFNTLTKKGVDDVAVSMQDLAVMHTSTNKPYLIFNGIITLKTAMVLNTVISPTEDGVYAVPLIPYPLDDDPNIQGTIAAVTSEGIPELRHGLYQVPHNFYQMPTSDQEPVRVGGHYHLPGKWISEVFVDGDSVYTAFNGPDNANQGIFKSTAIFNKNGFIRAWTPAQRVMGSIQKVFGAGLDTQTGDFYFLSNSLTPTSENSVNTGQVSVWGKGDTTFHGGTSVGVLSTVLEKIFPQSLGGVHQIFNFDQFTPGFTQGRFSMMVAVGFGRIALIQTGSYVAGEFTPTEIYELNTNVFVLNDSVIAGLGPICCAAIGLTNADFNDNRLGYLYVSGFGGIVQLGPWILAENGKGLDNLNAQINLIAETSTKIAGDIVGPVYRVATMEQNLLILTSENLYNRYLDGSVINGINPLPVVNGADMLTAGDLIFVASSNGIQYTDAAFEQLTTVDGISGHAIQLQYLSPERGGVNSIPGNIYALVLGQRIPETLQQTNRRCPEPLVPQVWRCAVEERFECEDYEECEEYESERESHISRHNSFASQMRDGISVAVIDKQKIPANSNLPGPFIQYGHRRSNIYCDGSMLLSMQPKQVTGTDFLRALSVVVTPTGQTSSQQLAQENSITGDLNLDLQRAFNVGLIERDSTSGAWVLPGDWGIRVND